METNLKMRREKYFPGIHKFEKLLRWLWSQFRSSCSELEWKKPTTVNSQHVQEGYESFHMAVSDLKDTFHGLYIFCTRSQGVPALVSVSDGKIPITILILRRGPCLAPGGLCSPCSRARRNRRTSATTDRNQRGGRSRAYGRGRVNRGRQPRMQGQMRRSPRGWNDFWSEGTQRAFKEVRFYLKIA